MKKLIAVCLCLITLFATTISVYASDYQIYSNNVTSASVFLSISSTGKATATLEYYGKSGVMKSAKVVTKIQKKVGVVWVTVSNGSWTDSSSATHLIKEHSVQLSGKGTYRAYSTFTFSGTGGSDDKITKTSEKTY